MSFLLIDDDEIFHFVNSRLIRSAFPDARIDTATNGRQALEIMTRRILAFDLPDFIVVDLDMPVMNGFQFLEHVKSISPELFEKKAVVILTSSSSKQDRDRATSFGVRHFLVKPLTRQALEEVFSKDDQ